MSTTPAPLPVYNAAGRRNRGFRHQVLGYRMSYEWLEKRSKELYGSEDPINIPRAAFRIVIDAGVSRPLHAVYDRETKEHALVFSLGENTTPEIMQEPPEKTVEWVRNFLGATGRPLWYDVV